MPDIILPNLGLELPDVGSDQDTWGDILNADLTILDTAVQYDVVSKTLGAVDVTLTDVEAASAVINLTGTLTANVSVIVPASPVRLYLVRNGTSGAFTVTIKTAAETGVSVLQGTSSLVYSDGTNIVQGATSVNGSFTAGSINNTPIGSVTPSTGSFTNLAYTGTLTGGTGIVNIGSGQIYKDALGNVGIGTSSPVVKLDVQDVNAQIRLTSTTGTNSVFANLINNGGNLFVGRENSIGTSFAASPYASVVFSSGNYPLELFTNGAKRLTIDSAGNAGLGVTPVSGLDRTSLQIGRAIFDGGVNNAATLSYNIARVSGINNYIGSDTASIFDQSSNGFRFFTAPSGTAGNAITFTQAMTLSQAGNLLLGTTLDGGARATIQRSGSGVLVNLNDTVAQNYEISSNALATTSGIITINTVNGGAQAFSIGGTEAARITSARYFKASNTGTYVNAAASYHEARSNQNETTLYVSNTNTGSGVNNYVSLLPSGAAGLHALYITNASAVYQVLANGNVQNANNSYSGISSIRFKTDVVDSPSYIDRFMQVRFVNFRFKEETGYDQHKQFGVIAEELETVFPGLVDETPDTVEVTKTRIVEVPAVLDEEGNEVTPATTREEEYTEREPNGEVTKSVKYSILAQIQGKVIQEQQAIIQSQQAQIDAILQRLTALESA